MPNPEIGARKELKKEKNKLVKAPDTYSKSRRKDDPHLEVRDLYETAKGHPWEIPENCEHFRQDLSAWMRDMYRWGMRVREDILKLEKHTKHPPGDPGSPPIGPWEPDP